MTSPNRATVWLRLPSGRCDPVEVDIDPPDPLAAASTPVIHTVTKHPSGLSA